MKLQASQQAIPFTTTDIFGKTVSLKDYHGKKLLLSFYRYASCPLCNLQIHRLIKQYNDLEARGLQIVAFFQSPSEKIRKYVTSKQDVPFPIIADPSHSIYKLYHLEGSNLGFIKGVFSGRMMQAHRLGLGGFSPDGIKNLHPADFLIAPDQTIHTAFYGGDIGEHIPFEQINQFLDEPQFTTEI